MLVIAVIGNIAAGKTVVLQELKKLGFYIISADEINKNLLFQGTKYHQAISMRWPRFLLANGSLDTKKIREHIFLHKNARIWLEKLLHPEICMIIKKRILHARHNYIAIEVPVTRTLKLLPIDKIINVVANSNIRLQRLIKRDYCSWRAAKSIIHAQNEENKKQKLFYRGMFIINNNNNDSVLVKNISYIMKKIFDKCLA